MSDQGEVGGEGDARGCFVVIGLLISALAIGSIGGGPWGWLALGVAMLLIGLLSK